MRVIDGSDDAAASQLRDVFAGVSDVLEDFFGMLPERRSGEWLRARVVDIPEELMP